MCCRSIFCQKSSWWYQLWSLLAGLSSSSSLAPPPTPYYVLNLAARMILCNYRSDPVILFPQNPQWLPSHSDKSQSPYSCPRDIPSITSLVSSPPTLLIPLWPHWPPCRLVAPLEAFCPCTSSRLTSHPLEVCSEVT